MDTEITRLDFPAFQNFPLIKPLVARVLGTNKGSGERLTALIGVMGADGAVEVIQSIRPDTLDCMYGACAKNAKGFLDLGMASLRCHLQTFREFSGWTAPVGGFSLGPIFEARSDTLFGVLRQAIQLSASLSALDDADEENESATPSNEQQTMGANQLRALVASQRPDLAAFFNVKMRFRPDSRPIQMGFLGMGMAAHFGVIRPNRVSSAIRDAHAKLWELQQAKGNVSGCL
ncbi:MAG: hypothetical protein IPL99_11710 [Candidatus Competibacteraceae bacterium]|nr:hypothetical protein [Candidatus Competibacteraceae bacterium]